MQEYLPGTPALFLQIKSRVHAVNIFLIQLFTQLLNGFAEPLEMNNFPFPKKFDHIIYIGIVGKTENVVVGDSCLLFWERIA